MKNSKESNRLVIQLKIMNNFQANQAYTFFVVVLDVYFDVNLHHLFLLISFLFLFILFPLFFSRCIFYPVKISAQNQSIQAMVELRRQCAKTHSNQNFNLEIKSNVYVA